MRRLLLAVGMAALAVSGCDCGGGPGPATGGGELKVAENQIEFGEACPKPSDPNLSVEQVTRQVHLKNEGNADLYINSFEVEAGFAEVFLFDPATVPETLPSLGEAAIDITFVPQQSGVVVADLTVVGEEQTAVVKLLGTGKSLPPHPALTMSCPGGAFEGDACATETPNLFFKATPIAQSNEMTLTLKNGGCPTLVVSNLAVTTDTADGAAADTFALAEGQASDLSVTGGGTGEIKVRFTPGFSGVFNGELTFETNDPERRTLSLPLKGAGTEPVLAVETTIGCGFPDPSARPYCCDFKPKGTACTGRFALRNTGTEPLTINRVYVQNANPMFQLEDVSTLVGTEIPANTDLEDAITVTYVPAAESASDFLIVESTGGNAQAELRGGSPPFLQTFPVGLLDFGTGLEVTEDYWEQVQVMNLSKYNQQLPLNVSRLEISQAAGVPAFDLSTTAQGGCTPTLADGEAIPAGESREVCVHFKSTVNGGTFSGTLTIESDDPSYPESSGWYRLSLGAQSQCNPAPVAEITVPLEGTDCASCNATPIASECVNGLCHAIISPHEIISSSGGAVVLSGERSHDLKPNTTDGQCTDKDYAGVVSWTWSLSSKPNLSTCTTGPTSSCLSVDPTGESNTTTLTFDKVGLYQIKLKVTDATGLESAETTFTVNVKAAS